MSAVCSTAPRYDTTERLLAGVLSIMQDGVSIVDQDARIVMVNPAYTRHFGWQPSELLGRPFTEQLDEADRAGAMERHVAGLAEGLDYERIGNHRCADGRVLPIRTRSITVEAGGRRFRIARVTPLLFGDDARRLVAGKLQVVGLDRVRDALGQHRWQAVKERAFATAEGIVRRNLGRRDTLGRTEDGFVVCFADLTEDEAGCRAAEISEEITRRLASEVAESAARTVSFAAQVEVPAEDEAAAALGDTSAVTLAVQRKLAETRRAMMKGARAMLARAVGTARMRTEPVFQVSGRRSSLLLGSVGAGLDIRLERLAESGWEEDGTDLAAELALLRVGVACAWLAGDGMNEPGPLVMSVPYDAVARRAPLGRVADMCREIPDPLRERLVIELRGTMPDTPRHRLCEAVQTLAPILRGVAVELPSPACAGLLDNLGTCLHLVTIHADAALPIGPDRLEGLTALAARLSQQKLRLLVREVPNEDALVALYGSGVALVSGRALGAGDPG